MKIKDALLNVNGSFDIKKTLTKPFIEFIFFVQKYRPISIESHMYKVTNQDGRYFIFFYKKWSPKLIFLNEFFF